jgi:hypothetical protein
VGAIFRYTPRRDFYGTIADTIVVTLRDNVTGAIITRSVQVRSFQSIAGSFEGALTDGIIDNLTHGKVQLSLTRDAGVSARITLRNRSFSVAGQLEGRLQLLRTVRFAGGGSARVFLQYDDINDDWKVEILQGTTTYTTLLERTLNGITDRQGLHTMVLRDSDSSVIGYATLTVGRNGFVNATGEMIWGGSWTASGSLRPAGQVVSLFKSYSGPQTRCLSLGIEAVIGLNTGSADAGWYYRDKRVAAGSEQGPVVLAGEISRYIRPARGSVIFAPYAPAVTFGLLEYTGTVDGVFMPVSSTATSTTQSGVAAANNFLLRLDPVTGRWLGSMRLGPDILPIRGVWLQSANAVFGFSERANGAHAWWSLGEPTP